MKGVLTFLRRFGRNRAALAGSVFLLGIYVVTVFAPVIVPQDPYRMNLREKLESPSSKHLLGTDELGRDVLSRIMLGTRISLTVGFIAAGISAVVGVTMGLVAGYFSGIIDTLIMGLVDLLMSFPPFLLILAVVAIVPPSLVNIMVVLGLTMWSQYARIVRGNILTVKEQDFVEAARALGAGNLRIMWRHLLPNVMAPVIVVATLNVAGAILLESGLSFLGFGAQPPTPSWGNMIATGRVYLRQAPHIATSAGMAIFLTVLAFNLVGDGLRDVLDPRLKGY
ncbi:TPA: ABC transporter permease [Candidatus Bipolaricaulota bacterium]|nr:ABC transporter permease [Candidatus Bipolaricaulota bacterium]HIP99391.1 ABC transporter permease [Candidatus Bipolaricaulota bacterium]